VSFSDDFMTWESWKLRSWKLGWRGLERVGARTVLTWFKESDMACGPGPGILIVKHWPSGIKRRRVATVPLRNGPRGCRDWNAGPEAGR